MGLLVSLSITRNRTQTHCDGGLSSIGRARAGARRGLLIRGGDILEAASRVDTVVFDKTGTLTAGKPSVTGVVTLGDGTHQHVLAMAAAVERQTNHPIAQAIVRHAHGAGALISYFS